MPETLSFYESARIFFIHQEGDLPYKVLTGITKAGSMALILVGLGEMGIGVATGVLNPEDPRTVLAGLLLLSGDKLVDSCI